MNTLALIRAIGAKAEELHPYLNAGGCCVYASKIVDLLIKRGIEAWGIVASDAYEEIPTLDKPIAAHHVLVGFRYRGIEYIHDSSNTRLLNSVTRDPSLGYPLAQGRVPADTLRHWISHDLSYLWNDFGFRGSKTRVDRAIRTVLQSKEED